MTQVPKSRKRGRPSSISVESLPAHLGAVLAAIGFFKKGSSRKDIWTKLPDASENSLADRLTAVVVRAEIKVPDEDAREEALNRGRKQLLRYTSGKSTPPAVVIYQLAKLSDIPADWILEGKTDLTMELLRRTGQALNDVDPTEAVAEYGKTLPLSPERVKQADFAVQLEKYEESVMSEYRSEAIMVPFHEVRASAGPGEVPVDEFSKKAMPIARVILRQLGIAATHAALLSVRGDSAEPTLSEGDIILIDQGWRDLRDGCMYVIGIDDDVIVKRVERLMDGSVILKSDNPAYSPQTVPVEEVNTLRVIGRVRWALHQL